MSKRLVAVVVLAVMAALLAAGCGGSSGPAGLDSAIRAVEEGWRDRDASRIAPYVSADYYFDGLDDSQYLSDLAAQFAEMDTVSMKGHEIEVSETGYAWVRMDFTAYARLDVAAMHITNPIYERAFISETMRQLWIKDFDGRWRLAAEYVLRGYALRDTPDISYVSLVDGDELRAGTSVTVYGTADSNNNDYRVTMWVDAFDQIGTGMFGWEQVDFQDVLTVPSTAYGPYAVSFVAQTDDPNASRMRGRTLESVYVDIYGTYSPFGGEKKPAGAPTTKGGHGSLRTLLTRPAK